MYPKIDNLKNEAISIFLKDLLKAKVIRNAGMKILQKKMWEDYVEKNVLNFPTGVQEDKYYLAVAYLNTAIRAVNQKLVSRRVLKRLIAVVENSHFDNNKTQKFKEKYGFEPPLFLTVSPTKYCNLRCTGCYASSSADFKNKLPYELVKRIIGEEQSLWGRHFTVISGGEPFIYRDAGKDIIDLATEFPSQFFLVYTNGTLIDERTAERLAEIGNITPAISIEGFEEETDKRRGKGIFKKILKGMENLRKVGVPFGISITATRSNYKLVVSDELYDFFFDKQGALYAWIFQYMPIGRSFTIDMMPTPEERLYMWKRERILVREKKRFIADFWNSGPISNGCICSGKDRSGYFYIDWNGNVMPCVFIPYYKHNIKEIYGSGGNLNTLLLSPFYYELRKWHHSYILDRPPEKMGNMLAECAIRDHYRMLYQLIKKHQAHPEDEAALQALQDENYRQRMIMYGKKLKKIMDPVWDKFYLKKEKNTLKYIETAYSKVRPGA